MCLCVSLSTLPGLGSSDNMICHIDVYTACLRLQSRLAVEINPRREKEWRELPKPAVRYPSTSNGYYCELDVKKKYVITLHFIEASSKFNSVMDVVYDNVNIVTKAIGTIQK